MTLASGSAHLAAQEQPRTSERRSMVEKGSVEVAGVFGSTLPVGWLRAHPDRRLTMGAIEIGRVLAGPVGRGALAGSFEFLADLTPIVAIQQPARTLGFGGSPLHLRWNFIPEGARHLSWFAEASGGLLYTSDPVPPRAAAFNFIDQAGFGLRIATQRNASFLGGYRFQHISNGGRVQPNPGVNFNFLYVGVSYRR